MMNSNKKIARTAGLVYFVHAILGGFSILYVPTSIIVPGDVTAITNNIIASETLFRLGAVSGLLAQVIFLLLGWTLYKLFQEVNKGYASFMLILVVAAVPIAFLNTLNQFAALHLLGGADYLTVFEEHQLNALVMLFLNLNNYGLLIVEVFWGLWLLPFGLLVIRSEFIPKILGYLLIIACFGYVTYFMAETLFPDHPTIISSITGISKFGEIPIIFWLLIKGVKEDKDKAVVKTD